MEEEKLIRKKKKALNGSNKRALAEACNDLATFYNMHNRYSDALDEYKAEASIYKGLGLWLEWGTCNRMIAEMYMLMNEFDKALKYEERHLATAKSLNDQVEEQRAMATLGRIHLLQGQTMTDEKEAKMSLKAAEKAFLKSLELCESLNGKINKHELMDMRARLLLNIGVVQEHLGSFDKALDCINKAIIVCSSQDLYDILHKCYTTEALLYSIKKKDFSKALNCLNKALEVASRLEDKVLKTCETLSSKADILCKMSDYQSAKQVLLKAWKLKTPDEKEREDIESNLKVVAAMCYTEDLLISTDPSDHLTFKKLYEKLGDGACHLQNYSGAVDYYLKMLDHAELAGECGKKLTPIYVSLSQTYNDMGCYNEALQYYEKEYELIKDVPKEAYSTLSNIAEALFLAKKPYDQIEKACLDARKAAQHWNKKKKEIRILKNLLIYQEKYFETDRMEDTKAELRALGYDPENSEDEQSSAGDGDEDITHIGDDICLEALTDLSDTNEEELTETKRETRKRGKGFTIKKNMKGETQLHVACISGNKLLVDRLLAKGHPVNVRDNAGWLPLHEACINGYLEVANILINHGANINDRGGVNCDGITPLYDAASNGHLEVVQLLLEKGAIPSIKTDFGETPLDVLQKWRTGTILTKDQEVLYNNICNKIHSFIDKTNAVEILNRSKSITPVKAVKDISPPSTSKMTSKIKEVDALAFKRRNIIDDDDDSDEDIDRSQRNQPAFPSDDSDSSDDYRNNKKDKYSGYKEYRNAISALRNRCTTDDLPEVDLKKDKPKSALLNPDEVDDDWLDDDMELNKLSKKRKLSDPLTVVAKKPSYESLKDKIENLNRIEPLVDSNKINTKKKSLISDVIDVSENSSDSDNLQRIENISPGIKNNALESMRNISRELNESKSRDTRENMRKRWKTQSTLLKAGFQRKRNDFDQSSNSGSDTEFNSRKELKRSTSTGTFSRKSSEENFFSTSDGFNVVQNMNAGIMQPMNLIQPIKIMQPSKNGKAVQTQILPPAAVKVQVEDKVFLISLKLDRINRLTISWLVDEVKSRYYKLTGVRPVFSLMTSDGAILSEDDPLSLVLASPELKTCITDWQASPAEERYLECCGALGIATSEEIQQAVGRSHTTHRLSLGAGTLSRSQIRPLFRALTYQTHITAIMVSNNSLGNDGMKFLTDCMITMRNLTHLDVSRNNITADGTKVLLNSFEKASRPICQALKELDFSGNPISDEGFKNIIKLCQYVKLKVLKLNCCQITNNASCTNTNFDNIESIDVSNNELKYVVVSCLVASLNPNSLTELGLDNVGVEGNVVGCIASFMDTAKELKIRRFSLSNCKLVDGQFMRIYRCLGQAKHLQSITLKNNLLTFITLKKLLQRQPPIPQINLEGCHDIFKYSPDSDFRVWLPAIDFGRCIPEINVTPVLNNDQERESLRAFSDTWWNCFKGITPLYDAASNGHLEVVQLLLEKGAIPSIKTDFGETPLDVLQKWRTGTILTKDQEVLYNNICNKIHSFIDKTNAVEILNRSKSITPVKAVKDISPPSTSKMTSKIKEVDALAFKRRNIIDDDDDSDEDIDRSQRNQPAFPSDDSDSSDDYRNNKKDKYSGYKEYRNAISALRNRCTTDDLPEVDLKKDKPKSALLNPDEVDDDWLDDDMELNKLSKKRKLSDPLTVVAKKPSYESLKDKIENLNRIEPLVDSNKINTKKKSLISDVIDVSENSSDSDNLQRIENISPGIKNNALESMRNISRELNESKSRDTRENMRKRWKTQSTLLKAGFQRKRNDFDQSSNSGSDTEFNSRKELKRSTSTGTFSRKSSEENFFSTSDGFNVVQNMNAGIMQPMNLIQPIKIMQPSKNGKAVQTQILPPAAVKVQVEDKVFLISLKLDRINRLTISWLVDEVKSRYYKLTGVRPVFSLMTSDGAILSEDDPLSLVLASPELKTCITDWQASPAEERYLECCGALGIATSEEIQQAVGRSHTTHRLSLGAGTLSRSQIRPLFRALTYQTHITAIMVSNNSLGNDGMKFLTDCMITMRNLTHLDVSRNNITADGTKVLLNSFEKASRPICQALKELDFSGNPISDEGFKNIIKLCQYVKLKVLKLNCCQITNNASCTNTNFDNIESIDVSNNELKYVVVSCLVASLNPNSLTELGLDNVGVEGNVVGCIASFMDTAKELKIRRFSLSNCKLVDGQFMRIYRCLGQAKHLQSITLKNNLLTFITLKKLLQRQPPIPQINLEGCHDIFKYSPDSDFRVWLPAIDFGRCIPEINVTPVLNNDQERESLRAFSDTWWNCFKGRGLVIERGDEGVITFTAK